MPELPEVETIARDLRKAGIVGKTLTCARVFWERAIAEPSAPEFCQRGGTPTRPTDARATEV